MNNTRIMQAVRLHGLDLSFCWRGVLPLRERPCGRGERFVRWHLNGVAMRTPVSAYRVQCLKELTRRRQALPPQAAEQIAQWMDAARLSEA